MNPRQQEILKNHFDALLSHVQVDPVIQFIKRMHPGVLTDRDIQQINRAYGQARLQCMLEKFKQRSDGYRLLFLALQNTNHNDTVLDALKPGLKLGQKSVSFPATPGQETVDRTQTRTPRGATGCQKTKDGGEKIAVNTENTTSGNHGQSTNADGENIDQQDQMTLVLRHLQGLSSQMYTMDAKANNLSSKIDSHRDEIMTELGAMKSQLQSFKDEHRKEIEDLQKKLQSLEDAIRSNTTTQANLKKDIAILIDDVAKFKKEFEIFRDKMTKGEKERGTREYEILKKILEKLSSLDPADKDKMWQEIKKLRQDVDVLKESRETRSSIQPPRVPDTQGATATYLSTPCSRNGTITETDLRPLAKKVKDIWSPLSKHMGVDITKTRSGKGVMDDEGKAEAVLMKWFENSKDTGHGGPTWEELHSLISKVDKTLADDIVYHHQDNH